MSFFYEIQKGKISAPVYKSYSSEMWESAYALRRQTSDCDRIYIAGRIIFRILDSLRKVNATIPKWCATDLHIKFLVGLSNRDQMLVSQLLRDSFTQNKAPFMNDLEHFKVELPTGQRAKPDELGSSIVDSLSTVIPDVWSMKDKEFAEGLSDVEKIHCLGYEMNLCNTYQWVESLWRDCLWNGYEFIENGKAGYIIRAAPGTATITAMSTATTSYRRNMFQTNLAGLLAEWWQHKISVTIKHAITSVQFVNGITGKGKEKTVHLSSEKTDDASDEAHFEAFLAKELVQKDFYAEILTQPVSKLNGESVERLFEVWLVLRSLSRASAARMRDSPVLKPNTLAGFSCAYRRKELVRIVSKAAKLDVSKTELLLEFLTFRKNGQTLWSQPLVEVESDKLLLPFSALHQANPLYVLECWLPMLSLDVGSKGNPFEREVRNSLSEGECSPAIRDIFSVFEDEITFFPNCKGERNEEIDLIFLVNKTLFIGEVKCSVVPVEDIHFYNNRSILTGAVAQALRKAGCVARNIDTFSKQLRKRGFEVPDGVVVKPLVVTNNLVNSGYPINSVPVVDIPLLTRYLEGSLTELSYKAGLEPLKITYFYNSAEEAELNIDAYFSNPPQLIHAKLGLQVREMEVPANYFDKSLPQLTLHIFEVEVDVEQVKKRLGWKTLVEDAA